VPNVVAITDSNNDGKDDLLAVSHTCSFTAGGVGRRDAFDHGDLWRSCEFLGFDFDCCVGDDQRAGDTKLCGVNFPQQWNCGGGERDDGNGFGDAGRRV
jgi:hypothetical protein